MTRVLSDFECDTFFPLALGGAAGGEKEPAVEEDEEGEWKQSSKEEFDEWVGEEVPAGVQEENGTQYEFQMWERLCL